MSWGDVQYIVYGWLLASNYQHLVAWWRRTSDNRRGVGTGSGLTAKQVERQWAESLRPDSE